MRHGGKILIDQLEAQGATTAFMVPGESFLAALDGLHDSNRIKTVVCRQEGGASMMAEAWGKITGEAGVCFVTRGPGAANAMSGLHVAQQDSTPLVLFVGLPALGHEDREAFQEIEVKQLFSSFVKWAAVIRQTERIPEYVSRAFHAARSGRPGPVVLGLPEDMLSAECVAVDAKGARIPEPQPGAADIELLQRKLGEAQRPVMIVGGPGWSAKVQKAVEAFAERFDLPVAPAFRYQDYIDNRHRCHVGCAGIGIEPKLGAAIKEADVLLVVGARLGEMTTSQYALLDIPNPKQFLVHVHPSPDELGSVYRADLPIAATASAFAEALGRLEPPKQIAWSGLRAELRAGYEKSLEPIALPGAVKLADVVRTVSKMLPDDGIVTNGAGNYAAFVHRYFEYKGYRTQLAPTSGSMGYGLPAAIAAKLAHPTRAGGELPGRRLLPDDRAGAGNGGAVRPAHRDRDRQQRHLRHHPHAPGARVSQPRDRHHAGQSRLCGFGEELRGRRFHGGGDPRFRACICRGAEGGPASRDRAQDRPGSDFAAPDTLRGEGAPMRTLRAQCECQRFWLCRYQRPSYCWTK